MHSVTLPESLALGPEFVVQNLRKRALYISLLGSDARFPERCLRAFLVRRFDDGRITYKHCLVRSFNSLLLTLDTRYNIVLLK